MATRKLTPQDDDEIINDIDQENDYLPFVRRGSFQIGGHPQAIMASLDIQPQQSNYDNTLSGAA